MWCFLLLRGSAPRRFDASASVARPRAVHIPQMGEYDVSGGHKMAATAENRAATDRLSAVVNAYLAALREERDARAHRGHVSVAVRGGLKALSEELRTSLQEPERYPVREVAGRLRLLAEIDA